MPSSMRSACLVSPTVFSSTRRTAVYGPVRTVVWEGRAGDRSPYPDPDEVVLILHVVHGSRDIGALLGT